MFCRFFLQTLVSFLNKLHILSITIFNEYVKNLAGICADIKGVQFKTTPEKFHFAKLLVNNMATRLIQG